MQVALENISKQREGSSVRRVSPGAMDLWFQPASSPATHVSGSLTGACFSPAHPLAPGNAKLSLQRVCEGENIIFRLETQNQIWRLNSECSLNKQATKLVFLNTGFWIYLGAKFRGAKLLLWG